MFKISPHKHPGGATQPGQELDPRRKFLRLFPNLKEVPFVSCRTCALRDEPGDCEAAPCGRERGYGDLIQYEMKETQ